MIKRFLKQMRGKNKVSARESDDSSGRTPSSGKSNKSSKPGRKPISGAKENAGKSGSGRRPKHSKSGKRSGRDNRRRDNAEAAPWDPKVFQVPEQEGQTRFHDLELRDEIMHAVYDLGFQYCTPVQAATLPAALEGRDVAGRAQTGTGKTAAFLIGVFQHVLNKRAPQDGGRGVAPRALVLAPTRELVMQIVKDAEGLGRYCPVHTVGVFGGTDVEKQRRELRAAKPELVVATPGRLLDYKNRHDIDLSRVEILVIDEADRMLDMGFIPDVRKIVYSTPRKDRRQTMFFSATLSASVTRLASSWTRQPLQVDIDPEQVTVDSVNQVVYVVTAKEKFALLVNLLRHEGLQRVLLFANRRDTVARIGEELDRYGIECGVISGALPQNKRTRTLEAFREGSVRVLVATDVASRGLHIEGVDHVINYNIPGDPEDYVHRIGRTGRAGATGTSITFACEDEAMYIPDLEEFIGKPLGCTHPPAEWLKFPDDIKPKKAVRRSSRSGGEGSTRSGRRRTSSSGRSRGPRSRGNRSRR